MTPLNFYRGGLSDLRLCPPKKRRASPLIIFQESESFLEEHSVLWVLVIRGESGRMSWVCLEAIRSRFLFHWVISIYSFTSIIYSKIEGLPWECKLFYRLSNSTSNASFQSDFFGFNRVMIGEFGKLFFWSLQMEQICTLAHHEVCFLFFRFQLFICKWIS
jgi:hypothetical protein